MQARPFGCPLRDGAGVRNVHAEAVAVKLPPVKRAGQRIALHLAAVAQMGAEMGTERFHHMRPASLGAKQHHVFIEVEQRLHVTRR